MINKLVLGTAQFGMDYGINNKRGKIPISEVFKILKYAYKNKIHILATDYTYGKSEELIGIFMKKNKVSFDIISKTPAMGTMEIKKDFFNTLKKINQKTIYGYLVNNYKSFLKNPKIWALLVELKKKGKIRKIGFSFYYPSELEDVLKKNIDFDLVQIPYSIFDQRFSSYFKILKNKKIEIHARSIFLQGLFFKKPNKLGFCFLKIKPKLLYLNKISQKNKLSIASLCLNFVNLTKRIDKIIIGVDSLMHLKKDLRTLINKNKVKAIYHRLLSLKEEDENIILPTNWLK